MNRRWEWIILSVRSLTVFEENIVVTVLAKLVPLFFKCSYAFFYLPLSNWQVSVSDRYLFQSLFGSLLNYRYRNENVSLRHLSWICITSILVTGSKTVQFMEDLAVFTALNHSGSFGKNFVKFQKNKYVIYRLRVGPYGEKLWPRSWKCGLGQYFQNQGHTFSPYGPPSRQITHLFFVLKLVQ